MSLGIAFKGPEGIVLAADSRVTLNAQLQGPQGQPAMILPSFFDNATKLLKVKTQKYVGAITYGAGSIGTPQRARTAHSFLPEFEATLTDERLDVESFAQRLSDFFMTRWTDAGMPIPVPAGQDMIFLVGGYDDDAAAYGRVYEFYIPSRPAPRETLPDSQFGATWGGQAQIAARLVLGFDPRTPGVVREFLHAPAQLAAGQLDPLDTELKNKLQAPIPWQFLPLQDCVDLSIFLIRSTIAMQKWIIDVRGVGGAIDVATITRTEGFQYVQQKKIRGEVTE
jgi:hypothetical protein